MHLLADRVRHQAGERQRRVAGQRALNGRARQDRLTGGVGEPTERRADRRVGRGWRLFHAVAQQAEQLVLPVTVRLERQDRIAGRHVVAGEGDLRGVVDPDGEARVGVPADEPADQAQRVRLPRRRVDGHASPAGAPECLQRRPARDAARRGDRAHDGIAVGKHRAAQHGVGGSHRHRAAGASVDEPPAGRAAAAVVTQVRPPSAVAHQQRVDHRQPYRATERGHQVTPWQSADAVRSRGQDDDLHGVGTGLA